MGIIQVSFQDALEKENESLSLGLDSRRFFRIRDESQTFWYRIHFAVYTQVDESVIKTFRFGRVSGDFESGI